jgi:hypothetical protein
VFGFTIPFLLEPDRQRHTLLISQLCPSPFQLSETTLKICLSLLRLPILLLSSVLLLFLDFLLLLRSPLSPRLLLFPEANIVAINTANPSDTPAARTAMNVSTFQDPSPLSPDAKTDPFACRSMQNTREYMHRAQKSLQGILQSSYARARRASTSPRTFGPWLTSDGCLDSCRECHLRGVFYCLGYSYCQYRTSSSPFHTNQYNIRSVPQNIRNTNPTDWQTASHRVIRKCELAGCKNNIYEVGYIYCPQRKFCSTFFRTIHSYASLSIRPSGSSKLIQNH